MDFCQCHYQHNPDEQLELFDDLSREERVLILLKNDLYNGSWALLEEDLRARLSRKPIYRKLQDRIQQDLARIANLRAAGY